MIGETVYCLRFTKIQIMLGVRFCKVSCINIFGAFYLLSAKLSSIKEE